MRLSYFLLVAASALLATGNALSTEVEGGKRSLRSLKTVNKADAQEEERGCSYCFTFDFNIIDDIFKALPEQFQRMRTEPETLRNMFNNWKTGYMSADDAVTYMQREGLSDKAIVQFREAYEGYIAHKMTKAAEKAAKKLAAET